MLRRKGRLKRVSLRQLLVYLAGVFLGMVIGTVFVNLRTIPINSPCGHLPNKTKEPKLILVGVMTAAKYIDTRAHEIWKTWAQHINGKVLFFVAEDTKSTSKDLPLINLKGVTDIYPPQKKSFSMLKWMADNHLDDYDWFMRADDDLYVRADRLESLLRSLDSSKAQLLGQAGLGNSAEYGQLALGQQDNYCMGGPGVVMSRETLRAVAPHLRSCLMELLTTHEDVELGRCIKKHVGVMCTWNYEMHTLFHNNQTVPNVYQGNLAELRRAITLHPIKQPTTMRRVHLHNRALRLAKLRSARLTLRNELLPAPIARPPPLIRHVADTTRDLIPWDFISSSSILFCAGQLFDEFNSNARQRGRVLQFQNIQYGYMRVEPRFGVDYVLDMVLWFKKFRPPHRATLSVRRHAYIQQTFGPLAMMSDRIFRSNLRQRVANNIQMLRDPNGTQSTEWQNMPIENSHVHLILPLAGRADTFKRFASSLRSVCANPAQFTLIVVLFDSTPIIDAAILMQIRELQMEINVKVISMGAAPFSRGIALSKGTEILGPDALMFFIDVDMLFTCDALSRVALNTVRGAQVYFPIVFSEYSPETWSDSDRLLSDAFHYGRKRGYFRHFGFGLVSIYKSDLDLVGGLNTNIQGWGMEDVDLFEKCVKSPLRVMRAPDPGLVHIYHTIRCNESMPEAQYAMCVGSRAASLASLDSLVDQISVYS